MDPGECARTEFRAPRVSSAAGHGHCEPQRRDAVEAEEGPGGRRSGGRHCCADAPVLAPGMNELRSLVEYARCRPGPTCTWPRRQTGTSVLVKQLTAARRAAAEGGAPTARGAHREIARSYAASTARAPPREWPVVVMLQPGSPPVIIASTSRICGWTDLHPRYRLRHLSSSLRHGPGTHAAR